jgi:xanthine dehydrogenase molybdopterin-binding subunit B
MVTFTQYPRMIRDRLVRVQGGKWKILVSDVQFISLHMAIVERK